MPKAFLSHSSKDKEGYVKFVAEKLKKINCIYDEATFEEGMKNFDEIEKNLEVTDLFVIFLSNQSLESLWVKRELKMAYKSLRDGNLRRIYPIIIDKNINYKDTRIPKWMRDEYNLKFISKPSLAAKRIKQKLCEISWDYNPKLKEREQIFVGRNELIKLFEERIDTFQKPTPTCIVASGLKYIGRRSLLKYCLVKSNIIDYSYEPSTILLNSNESLEDFILKTYDLGFSNKIDLTNFMHKTIDEKIAIAIKIVKDIQDLNEIIFIIDNGCIVTPDREITEWFKKILREIETSETITFGIASIFRVFRHNINDFDTIFTLEVPELSKSERIGLLRRYSNFEGLNLSTDDLNFFSDLLQGYPQQIFYAVDLIKDYGTIEAKQKSTYIVDFNAEKATTLVSKYELNEDSINFLYFLSSFEFIGYELIFEIVEDNDFYRGLLGEFIGSAICEYLGANREYIRVNDAIKNYVQRNRIDLPNEYKAKLQAHLNKFLLDSNYDERDVSDFLYSMKEALVEGKKIDEKYLIPSHFLTSMVEQYNRYKNYSEVVKLADRVLENERYIDEKIITQIRYYLCMSLAHLRDTRFLSEVNNLKGPDHNFVFGFYYRYIGKNAKAIDRLKKALRQRPDFQMAKRELVQAYMNMEDHKTALELAKENYVNMKSNPYHIHAYLKCLIKSGKSVENKVIAKVLLENLSKIDSVVAMQMYAETEAEYLAFFENKKIDAIESINLLISNYPKLVYPYFAKFSICEKFNDTECMGKVINELENLVQKNSYYYYRFITIKAKYWAKMGKSSKARDLIESVKDYYTEEMYQQLLRVLYEYSKEKGIYKNGKNYNNGMQKHRK